MCDVCDVYMLCVIYMSGVRDACALYVVCVLHMQCICRGCYVCAMYA